VACKWPCVDLLYIKIVAYYVYAFVIQLKILLQINIQVEIKKTSIIESKDPLTNLVIQLC
jgi:hypothetical protein